MFHHRRRHPLADILNWTDYRVGGMPPPLPGLRHGFGRGFGHPFRYRRRSPLTRLLIGIAILVAVVYVFQQLTGSRNRSSWL